jgi:hypothetical protein
MELTSLKLSWLVPMVSMRMKNTGTPTTPAIIMEFPRVSRACDDASASQVMGSDSVSVQRLCEQKAWSKNGHVRELVTRWQRRMPERTNEELEVRNRPCKG